MAIQYLDNEAEKIFADAKKYLYRTIRIDRLLDMLQEDKWGFPSPTTWDDPYEKVFLEGNYYHRNKVFRLPIRPQKKDGDLHYRLFCMCWTEIRESEAFWKTYTPNGDGVRISVKATQLKKALSDIAHYDVYVGRLKYQTFDDLYDFKTNSEFWKKIRSPDINKEHLELMLKKRIPFEYEKEFRILLVSKEPVRNNIALVNIGNTIDLIHHYKFDPRMGESLFEILRNSIANQYHVKESKMTKSKLYKKPSGKISFSKEEL